MKKQQKQKMRLTQTFDQRNKGQPMPLGQHELDEIQKAFNQS